MTEVTDVVGEVFEDKRKPGRRARVESVTVYGWAAMRTIEHSNPRAVGRLFYAETNTLARHWARVDAEEPA